MTGLREKFPVPPPKFHISADWLICELPKEPDVHSDTNNPPNSETIALRAIIRIFTGGALRKDEDGHIEALHTQFQRFTCAHPFSEQSIAFAHLSFFFLPKYTTKDCLIENDSKWILSKTLLNYEGTMPETFPIDFSGIYHVVEESETASFFSEDPSNMTITSPQSAAAWAWYPACPDKLMWIPWMQTSGKNLGLLEWVTSERVKFILESVSKTSRRNGCSVKFGSKGEASKEGN
jgi:hypothetical protein